MPISLEMRVRNVKKDLAVVAARSVVNAPRRRQTINSKNKLPAARRIALLHRAHLANARNKPSVIWTIKMPSKLVLTMLSAKRSTLQSKAAANALIRDSPIEMAHSPAITAGPTLEQN